MKNIRQDFVITAKTFLAMSLLASSVGSYADDTEIFYTENVSKPNLLFVLDYSASMSKEVPNNDGKSRLEILQSSIRSVLEGANDNVNIGIMGYGVGQRARQPDNTILFKNDYRIEDEGHRTHGVNGVSFPIRDINAKANETIKDDTGVGTNNLRDYLPYVPDAETTVREYVADIVSHWGLDHETPIVDSLYEAALYYRGERMHYGHHQPNEFPGAHPSTYVTEDVAEITSDIDETPRDLSTAPNYISPIQSHCQSNYIVMMSDGGPAYRYERHKEAGKWVHYGPDPKQNDIGVGGNNNNKGSWGYRGPFAQNMLGNTSYSKLAGEITGCVDNPNGKKAGKCGSELMQHLATTDNSDKYEGVQTIKSFVIGFANGIGANDKSYLKSLVTASYDHDGVESTAEREGYFEPTSEAELVNAFNQVLEAIVEPRGTLASPGYSVNVKNGLEHEKDIYIPVFDRQQTSRWSGNIKKFKIVDENNKRKIKGKNDLTATDEEGSFTPNALDYWSTAQDFPDGADTNKGGVANLLNPVGRKLYTNLTGTTNVTLTAEANTLSIANIDNLTYDKLGLDESVTEGYRKKIVNFMRGWVDGIAEADADNPTPEKRYYMGDMLHSEPLVLTYNVAKTEDDGTTTAKEQYIFAATNEGYIHAFDTDTGEEKFAFIPAELLKKLPEKLFLNAGTEHDHEYALDGAITGDFIGGADGSLDNGDRIILYFGMRRGGTAYYALDVTDIDAPKLIWKKSQEDHASMGQSWSTPYVATIKDATGVANEVVIISAGYDDDEDRDVNEQTKALDDSTVAVTANVGNDILIFDAIDGTKLWSMPDTMRQKITSSIPGGITPLDTNNNKLIDRIYFGDTGGNIWRLDLDESNISNTSADDLTKLASVGQTGSIHNRMFFNTPDVSLMRLNGRNVYAVSIGSGFRAHPMDDVIKDKFYVIIDSSPFSPLEKTGDNAYETLTDPDLDSDSELATIVVSEEGDVTVSNVITESDIKGYAIEFPEDGEKVLGEAKAINGSILFPTLVPTIVTEGLNVDLCQAPVTKSRAYALDILTGKPKFFEKEGTSSTEPEYSAFTGTLGFEIISSIDEVFNTPEPAKPILNEEGEPTTETECLHTVDLRVGKKNSQVSGYNSCTLESVYWSDPVEVEN